MRTRRTTYPTTHDETQLGPRKKTKVEPRQANYQLEKELKSSGLDIFESVIDLGYFG
jgi:hypothetical protein